jgi:hypothetical protein
VNRNSGYYVCNGVEFNSKVDAMLFSKVSNQPVQWMFHQDFFSKYPWHIEPAQTLDELYDKRSRELREKYDYIILSYSGGSDSNNILESFLRQGLHIDEIVTNHMSGATSKMTVLNPAVKDSWNFAAEHDLQAMPRLKYVSEKSPRTKITILDVSGDVRNSMLGFDDVDWVLHRNDHLSIGQLFRYNYFHFGSIKKQLDKNLKVGIIVGLDKPKTYLDKDNNFMMFFNDATANITTIDDFNTDYDNTSVELFYWSPEAADILCKQCHIIIRWLEKSPRMQEVWKHAHAFEFRKHYEPILKQLIYTTWDNNWFQAEKSSSWFHTEFDTWFRNDQSLKKEQENWKRGIQYLIDSVPDQIIYGKTGRPESLKQFKYEYLIKKVNNEIIRP